MPRLPPRPDLCWTDDGAPRSRTHDDIYFSRAGGLAESEAVFLEGCGLPYGWSGASSYTIGELGFGCGLNLLAVWRAWRATRKPSQRLHFISIEGFPLTAEEAARALAPFEEVQDLARRLLERWPVRAAGVQRLWFDDEAVCLTLHHTPVETALARMEGPVNAWFLDGFAPARNPAMWSPESMAQIGRLSAPGARLATYSVAGQVRRALGEAGFTVEKKPGYVGKRERLEARRSDEAISSAAATGPVAIIGAGVAGASLAFALRLRGREVVVLDAGAVAASGASGNPVGLLSPRLDRTDTGIGRLHIAAYLYALDLYRTLGLLRETPVISEPRDARAAQSISAFLDDPPLPPSHLHVEADALHHRSGGVIAPREIVRRLLDGVTLRCGVHVSELRRAGSDWIIVNEAGDRICAATHVVIAAGPGLAHLAPASGLPVELLAGQMEWGAVKGGAPAMARERATYAAPYRDGIAFGATFDRVQTERVSESQDARARNLEALGSLAPDLRRALLIETLCSRAGVRVAAQDRAPILGPLQAEAGLFVLGALGSRGFSLAPLLAEDLASQICGEYGVLDTEMRAAVAPGRFAQRAAARQRPPN